MANLGKVTITPRGDYSNVIQYVKLDCVTNGGSSWLAKQSTLGNTPPTNGSSSNTYWTLLAKGFDASSIYTKTEIDEVIGDLSLLETTSNTDLVSAINENTSQLAEITNILEVNIRNFGAVGDGIADDTSAIQTAINYAIANNKKLRIPMGTFLLNGTRQEAYQAPSTLATNAILLIDSDFTMVGDGYNSVFKVADNYSDGGDYRLFASPSITVNNVEISSIRIDGNGQNNLVIDSGSNVRRGYMISLLKGDNTYIHDCWFENCPGRNCINLANNTVGEYDFTNVRIINNRFKDMGGAIVGNGNQNDHSTIYLQADHGIVHGNMLTNTVQPNPYTSPAKTINALEIHGRNTTVSENQVHNYTGGGNAVAAAHDGINNEWINNKFTGMTSNILTLWTANGYENENLVIRGNTFEIDNSVYNGGTAIYQGAGATVTTKTIKNLTVEDNNIYAVKHEQVATTFSAMALCAAEGVSFKNNNITNMQGAGVVLSEPENTALPIRDVDADGNTYVDCGIHSLGSRMWAVYISNTLTTREIANVRFRNSKVIKTLQPAGVTPWALRGMRVTGAGRFNNIVFENNEFEGIPAYTLRYDFSGITNAIGVYVVPKAITNPKASDPTFGIWQNANHLVEYVVHSDPVASGFMGRVPTTSGGAVSGTWSSGTTYNIGQWIKTSTNKVLRCVTAGTSHASVEPAPTATGIVVADGTVEWVYESPTLAVFKTYGAITA